MSIEKQDPYKTEAREPFTSDECQKANEMTYEPLSQRDNNFLLDAIKAQETGKLDQLIREYESRSKVKTEEDILREYRINQVMKELAEELKRVRK